MGLRVVLVDDDGRFRLKARRALEADGVEIVGEASTGAAALDSLATWSPDVVLLDIGLPDVDGLEVARQLQDTHDPPPVILISTREVEYGQLVATGIARGYIPKDALSLAAILEVLGPRPRPVT